MVRLRPVSPVPFLHPRCPQCPEFPLFPVSPGAYIHKRAVAFIPSIYLSISIFHIIQTREEAYRSLKRDFRFSGMFKLQNVMPSILPNSRIFSDESFFVVIFDRLELELFVSKKVCQCHLKSIANMYDIQLYIYVR